MNFTFAKGQLMHWKKKSTKSHETSKFENLLQQQQNNSIWKQLHVTWIRIKQFQLHDIDHWRWTGITPVLTEFMHKLQWKMHEQ